MNSILLDGSKLSWRYSVTDCDATGLISDFSDFPRGGRAPKQVSVFLPRSRSEVVFDFVEFGEDEPNVTLNYAGRLPDGRHCHLSLEDD